MSNRIEKVNSLLQKYISDIIQNDLNDPRLEGNIVSICSVSTTPDLKYSKVFLSIFGRNSKEALEAIKQASGYIKKTLAPMLNFRCTPSLSFELDDSAEYSEKINNILKTLKVEEDKKDTED